MEKSIERMVEELRHALDYLEENDRKRKEMLMAAHYICGEIQKATRTL